MSEAHSSSEVRILLRSEGSSPYRCQALGMARLSFCHPGRDLRGFLVPSPYPTGSLKVHPVAGAPSSQSSPFHLCS